MKTQRDPRVLSALAVQTAIAALLAVTSDSAGRNVYAVGAQRSGSTPPIMYSSNSGLNWVMQVAPAISGTNYLLTSVTAATGKVVYAAGGDTATGAGVVRFPSGWRHGDFHFPVQSSFC